MTIYPAPILTVDVVLLELREETLWVGILQRGDAPYSGSNALPGGFVHTDEDANTEATALRIIREKTGLNGVFCEQLGTFSSPDRDPRGWSATVVYYALVRGERPTETALKWVPVDEPGDLAFDHNAIVAAATDRLRAKGSWSNLPAFLLPPTFTYSELRRTYELVLGTNLNDSAFRRKMDEMNLIEPVVGQKSKATARPAQLFKLKSEAICSLNRRI
ncbi:NUDIX domain-containing protein [Roseibium sp. RKSG952]|nr:NUDIX domain-containing protein [Roseibium sp. RKSG952]MTH99321.1 NUDIX domain-containing protein [Roseibium sp. RKSG952]